MFEAIQAWLAQFALYIVAALSATTLLFAGTTYVQGHRMHTAKVALAAEKVLRKTDKAAYEQAQKEAERQALDQKQILERKYDDYKQEADRNYRDLRTKFDAALLRYKAKSTSGVTVGLPASPAAGAGSSAGTGQDPLVPVPMSDLYICTENTAKALIAHEWAEKVAAATAQ